MSQQLESFKKDFQQLLEQEKQTEGLEKIGVQNKILRYLYSQREILDKSKEKIIPDERVLQKYKGKTLEQLKPAEKKELGEAIQKKKISKYYKTNR